MKWMKKFFTITTLAAILMPGASACTPMRPPLRPKHNDPETIEIL